MNKQKGFTLIELLVVISIVSLLSSVVLASLRTAREKAAVAAGQQFSGGLYRAMGDDALLIYRFNESSGTLTNDESGNSRHGTLTGSVTRVTSPFTSGYALQFANTNDTGDNYVAVPSQSYSSSITIAAWIKTSTVTAGTVPIFSNRDTCTLYFGISSGKLYEFHSGNLAGNTLVNDTKWHHVAFTISGTSASFYVDGKIDAPLTAAALPGCTSAARIADDPGGFGAFNGAIDDLMVFKRNLSALDIRALYAAGAPERGLAVSTE